LHSDSYNELLERGLTSSQVNQLREEYGLNEIPEKKKNPLLAFLGYFWGPIPWMIEIAAVLSAILQRWEDFSVIVALMFLNAVVGFWQEHKADNAIELIKQKLAHRARVFRDHEWTEIDARDLVPGDFVRVRLGDIVPADIRLDEGEYLQIDQSALTGESLPVERSAGDTAYSGSVIRQGEMNGTVTAIGDKTYFGKTTKLVAEAKVRSHFQKAVIKIGDYLIVLALVLVTIIFIAALFRGESILDTLQFALVLIVAAIPVALPAVLTVTLAIGATSLAKKEAIVRLRLLTATPMRMCLWLAHWPQGRRIETPLMMQSLMLQVPSLLTTYCYTGTKYLLSNHSTQFQNGLKLQSKQTERLPSRSQKVLLRSSGP
jgi:H+-transporting ATPase